MTSGSSARRSETEPPTKFEAAVNAATAATMNAADCTENPWSATSSDGSQTINTISGGEAHELVARSRATVPVKRATRATSDQVSCAAA